MEANAYQNHRNIIVFTPPFYPQIDPLYPSFGVITPRFQFPHHLPLPPPLPLPVVAPPFGLFFDPHFFRRMEEERTVSLLKFMADEGLVPSFEEEQKRENVILKLKEVVVLWAKKIAWQRRRRREEIGAASATILTYGSYGLGVHGPDSDIDALCVGPLFATMAEDFFIVLRNMLKSIPEISDIHCVKDAKVPLMRFKFDGISIDLPYAQLKVLDVPNDLDIFNPYFLRDIDETSWKSLSGVRVNRKILQLVPNPQNFQAMLRCIKLWAKRRGVYGNLNGFLGGVHLAILAAYVSQCYPNSSLSALISNFFCTFATWPWPTPVVLQDGTPTAGFVSEARSLMPIRLPCTPHEYCHSNITKSTFNRIRSEFLRGKKYTEEILKVGLVWNSMFEPMSYSSRYSRFIKIYLSAPDQDALSDWVGWVKSRFPSLILKIEKLQGYIDPIPIEYVDTDSLEPNVVFYWGLNPCKSNCLNIESLEEDFLTNICSNYHGIRRKMVLLIIQASELPENALSNSANVEKKKARWKIVDCERMTPAYSRHLPDYFVGYVANNGDHQYPIARDLYFE